MSYFLRDIKKGSFKDQDNSSGNSSIIRHGSDVFLAPTGALEEAMLSVRACVRPFPQIMSSSSILKSPGGF